MTQRTERIDALLREEIGQILARDLADPAIGFTTVTDVETVPDLSHAEVWVSQIGQATEREASLVALRRALPYVRRLLGQRVRLRRIPELHLRVDDTAERGTRVLKLLAELESGSDPEMVPAAADPLPTPVARLPHAGDQEAPGGGIEDRRAGAGSGASIGRSRARPSSRTARAGQRTREPGKDRGKGRRR